MDQDGWPAVEPLLTKFGVNYPVLLGNRNTSESYGGGDVLPTLFLIDRAGRIADVHAGIINRKALEESLERLLSPGTDRSETARPKSRVSNVGRNKLLPCDTKEKLRRA